MMMTVFASESQKNPHSSLRPSSGGTSGEGVELPGVGVYGLANGAADPLIRRSSGDGGTYPIRSCSPAPEAQAANHGSRAAGPLGFRTRPWRLAPPSPGAHVYFWAIW